MREFSMPDLREWDNDPEINPTDADLDTMEQDLRKEKQKIKLKFGCNYCTGTCGK
jgi:hypothetical protein